VKKIENEPACVISADDTLYSDVFSCRYVSACLPAYMVRLVRSRLWRKEAGEEIDLGTDPLYIRLPDVHRKSS
ncbi:MAG: hypothetical protein J6M18_01045, partial [Actinomycetaceae bacterium]|nr:hypothetical protein [Actinomycetaceae bacterium]